MTRSPWLIHTVSRSPFFQTPSNSGVSAGDLQLGAAELAVVAAFDAAAHLRHHGLLAVADAEHRQARLEHPVGRARRAELGDAGRAAREDHGLGLQPLQGVLGLVEGHDLGVDALLAHAPGDQLRHLAAEIDDEDGVGHGRRGSPGGNRLHRQLLIDHRPAAGSSSRPAWQSGTHRQAALNDQLTSAG